MQCWGSLLTAVLLAGCAGDGTTLGPDGMPLSDGDEEAPPPTLTELSAEIFTPSCAISCHGGSFLSENMSLEADQIAANIIDVDSNQQPDLKRVAPGDAENSYLVRKIRGTGAGVQMPLGSPPLSPKQIERIVAWINAGASTE
ncbi:MAG: hypothetical protein VX733_09625 [Candidatus Latescibacterota bacterium]|nr:hypothetical protein [Candidatus Latescibacterota bacterium]